MIKRLRFSFIGALSLLCGCQSFPDYVNPTGGATAKIKFTTAGTKVGAVIYADEECSNPRWVGREEFVEVPADRSVVVSRGNFTVTFPVEAGKKYELQYGQGYPYVQLALLPLDDNGKWILTDHPIINPNTGKEDGRWPLLLPVKSFTCPEHK